MATPPDPPVYSLAVRKTVMFALAAPLIAVFLVMILHHKAFINIEDYGIPENYLYFGGLGLILVGAIPIFVVWRCPGCGKYLGRNASPSNCPGCGAQFH
jgi:hypothetical protein